MKKTIRLILYLTLGLISIVLLLISWLNKLDTLQVLSSLLSTLSLIMVGIELYQNRKISEGEFLANLNHMFIENDDFKNAYTLFENYDFENCPDLQIDNIHISNYLTFFEIFQLLVERETLTIDMFDDLFGYRFFIAVHNPYVQKQKLTKSPNNFRNLYILENNWIKYRKKKNMSIFHEEYSLANRINKDTYEHLLNKRV